MFFSAWGTIENMQNVEHFAILKPTPPKPTPPKPTSFYDSKRITSVTNSIKNNPLILNDTCDNIDEYDVLKFNLEELKLLLPNRDEFIEKCVTNLSLTNFQPNNYYNKMENIIRKIIDRSDIQVKKKLLAASINFKIKCENFMRSQDQDSKNKLMKIGNELIQLFSLIKWLMSSPPTNFINDTLNEKLALLDTITQQISK